MRVIRGLGHITVQALMLLMILFTLFCAAVGAFVLAFGLSGRMVDHKQSNSISITDCANARISQNSDLYSECKDSGNFYASPYEAREALEQVQEQYQPVDMQGK